MKKIILALFILICGTVARSQQLTYYKAIVKTAAGMQSGVLERAGKDYVEISKAGEFFIIPAQDIVRIKLKAQKNLLGYRMAAGVVKGAEAGTDSWKSVRVERLAAERSNATNLNHKKGNLAEAPAYFVTGAVAGAVIGALPKFKKSIKIRVDNSIEKFSLSIDELKRYAIYSQLAVD